LVEREVELPEYLGKLDRSQYQIEVVAVAAGFQDAAHTTARDECDLSYSDVPGMTGVSVNGPGKRVGPLGAYDPGATLHDNNVRLVSDCAIAFGAAAILDLRRSQIAFFQRVYLGRLHWVSTGAAEQQNSEGGSSARDLGWHTHNLCVTALEDGI
jgi:hypothetical protein